MTLNEISQIIVNTAIQVHRGLGPGLLESVYLSVMEYELNKQGQRTAREIPIPVQWQSIRLEAGFRADLIVEEEVIVELKSVEKTAPVHKKQLLTYLRLADKKLGLLLNYGEGLMKDGIIRIVNGLEE